MLLSAHEVCNDRVVSLNVLRHLGVEWDAVVVEGGEVREDCVRQRLLDGLEELSARHAGRAVE